MKKNNTFKVVVHSIIIVALAFVWIAGAIPAYGATTQQSSTALQNGYTKTQAQDLNSLGLATGQPSRQNPAGETINKNTDTPLGPNMVVENQTFQLAGAGLYIDKNPYSIYDLSLKHLQSLGSPPSSSSAKPKKAEKESPDTFNHLAIMNQGGSSAWYNDPKAMVGADLDGLGKDDLVTAALVPNSSNKNECNIKIIVTRYCGSDGYLTGSTTLMKNITKPLKYGNSHLYPIQIAAGDFDHDPSGKDEIAVVVASSLYVAQVSASVTTSTRTLPESISSLVNALSPNTATSEAMETVKCLSVSANLLWNTTYTTVSNTKSDWPKMDLVAADTTGDGYKDLLVTTGSRHGGSDGNIPKLLIYSDTPSTANGTAPAPTADISLSIGSNGAFVCPNVAVGDIFGNGVKDIVIAGKTETNDQTNPNHASLAYITYAPSTESYHRHLDTTTKIFKTYPLYISSSDPIKYYVDDYCMTGLAIAPLDGPVGPEFVACGDHVFRWDGTSFVDQEVHVNAGLKRKKEKHEAYMLDIVAGNFTGSIGKEEIAMLYNGYNGPNLTLIGEFKADSRDIVSTTVDLGKTPDQPVICAPDVLNNGLKYTYYESDFTFTNPTVIALLAPPPYYRGLPYKSSGDTSFGTGSSEGSGSSNGIDASAGIQFGFKQNINVIVNIGSVQAITEVKGSLSVNWSKSESIAKSVTFTNDTCSDEVVVAAVPEDIYRYKVENESNTKSTELDISVPYKPETANLPVAKYDSIVKSGNPNAPYIDAEQILGGAQPGNPASYPDPTSPSSLSNSTSTLQSISASPTTVDLTTGGTQQLTVTGTYSDNGTDDLTSSASYQSSDKKVATVSSTGLITAVADGTTTISVTDQGQTTTVSVSISSGWMGWFGNISSTRSILTSNSSSSTSSTTSTNNGVIVHAVVGDGFAGINVDGGSSGETITETTSQTTSVGASISISQSVSGDVFGAVFGSSHSIGYSHSNESTTSNSVSFGGNVAGIPNGYSHDYDFQYELVEYTYNLASPLTQKIDVVSYLVKPTSGPLPPVSPQNFKVDSVSPTSATLQWDPVSAGANPVGYYVLRSSTEDGKYSSVKTLSPPVGTDPIKWKDTSLQSNKTYYYKVEAFDGSSVGQPTSPLQVETSGALTLKVDFKVGTTYNATALVPNEPLVANAQITNNLNKTQNVIFITALYDDANGAMTAESHKAVTISPNSTSNAQVSFTLPADVTNATVASFIWDGKDLSSSSLVPLSNVVTIGS